MFAVNAEREELFRKGWPHLRVLVSPHPHENDAAKWAERALLASDPNVYHVEWPREVAYRFVRAMGAKRPATPKDNIAPADKADVAKCLNRAGPVDEKEARAIVAQVTDPRSYHRQRAIEDLLYLLEAMVGAEPVIDEALKRYEKMTAKELTFRNPHDLVHVAYWIGFLLKRMPEKAAKKHRGRIEALIDEVPKASSVRGRFLMVARGVKGIEESGYKPGVHIAHYANDPEFIVKHAEASAIGKEGLDMQIAYQAKERSEDVLRAWTKLLRKVPAWRLPFLVDELAVVASPTATAMLKELANKKPVAEKVKSVLAARAGKKTESKSIAKPKAPSSKKKAIADAEKRFDELSAWLASELAKVRGNVKKEAALLEEATNRYADIRTDIGEDPSEAIVHFFAADGCGYGKVREPALLRVKPTKAELERWTHALS